MEDKKHGQGKGIYRGGDVYEYVGAWENDKRHGQGKLTDSEGGEYVGGWEDGDWHGEGKLTHRNGTVYEAVWTGSWVPGVGTVKRNGELWSGTWQDLIYGK